MTVVSRLRLVAASAALVVLAACGGGGGSVPLAPPGSSATSVPTGSPTSTATGATSAPSSGTPTMPATHGPSPTPMPAGASPIVTGAPTTQAPVTTNANQPPAPTAPPDAAGHTNVVPTTPPVGSSRPGQIYNVYVTTSIGDTEAFTVFEPATLVGGQTYPLVLQAAGYGGARTQTLAQPSSPNTAGNIPQLVAAEYGVISLDQRGFGEDTGTVRSMDPDYEGQDYLAVMDWAQAKLSWLAHGTTVDGSNFDEPIMGAIGGSYGGMFQMLLANIDTRHRLHAITPQIAPYDLPYALDPNNVFKTAWNTVLYNAGQAGGSGASRANTDPFITQAYEDGTSGQAINQSQLDFFGYHSNKYWCNGTSIATNGGPGTSPKYPPVPPHRINALFFQGMRDTLFHFDEAVRNAACFAQQGGDVRLLSYQAGHNSLKVVPDPYVALYYPAMDDSDTRCGSLDTDAADLAFFNQYLKFQTGAANVIPTQPCLSIAAGDAVLVPSVTTGHAGTQFTVPSTTVPGGLGVDVPTAIPLGPAFTAAQVIGGIPRLEVSLQPVAGGSVTNPVVFVGIGQLHASQPSGYDLIDNEVAPLQGYGEHDIDLTGIAARYAAGDQLELLVFGAEDQYANQGATNPSQQQAAPLTISGNVWVPILSSYTKAP